MIKDTGVKKTRRTTIQKQYKTYVVIFFGDLFSAIGDVASVMVGVDLWCNM